MNDLSALLNIVMKNQPDMTFLHRNR